MVPPGAGDGAGDYEWLGELPLGAAFCFAFVRGVDEAEVLRRFGADPDSARPMTLDEIDRAQQDAQPDALLLAAVTKVGDWVVVVEPNGFQSTLDEVLSAVSAGGEVLSVYRNLDAVGQISHAVDGRLRTAFDQLVPYLRWGGLPDALLPVMLAVGLDPDGGTPPDPDGAALALAERVTGIRLTPETLSGALPTVVLSAVEDSG
ncbi:hypothetical protein JOF53_005820 [Crossiella equi]|uniref:Uncharacterized protein n=1 Tax=Crossiella equi TaxID=130796 RepID=A0ABS5AK52_9PSEU|nr:DUF6461 domain-containing protein [Crossiella equi]MBP2476948.1 hypothetical protein [Crossiella equi]